MPVLVESNNVKVDNVKIPEELKAQLEPSIPHSLHVFQNPVGRTPWDNQQEAPKPPKIDLPVPGQGLPRVLHYNADQSGCGFWRMIWPAHDLLAYNKAVVMTYYQMILDARFYHSIDAIRLQRQCETSQVEFIRGLREISELFKKEHGKGFRIIWEIDDLVCPVQCLPDYNVCKQGFESDSILHNLREVVKYIDEMTVVSEEMRKHYQKWLGFDKITVLPNYAPKHMLEVGYDEEKRIFSYKKNKKKPRILYAGSMTHFDVVNKTGQKDDFYHVVRKIHEDLTIHKKYEWVFLGGAMPHVLRPFIGKGVEFHPWTPIPEYPDALRKLNCQIMLAPLCDNDFNRSKSNIKLTEGGALGIPTVAQNLAPYNSDGWPYLFDTGEQMMQTVEKILKNESTYRKALVEGREYASKYYLKDHLDEFVLLYTTPYGDPRRKENKTFFENNPHQFR